MLKKIKYFIASVAALLLPMGMAAAPVAAGGANIQDGFCQGTTLEFRSTPSAGACPTGSEDTRVNQIVTTAINIFTWVVGVVAVIMIIVGGFRYITSGGDSGGVTSAKNTIMYAIIGLIVVVLAQVIVRFVLTNID